MVGSSAGCTSSDSRLVASGSQASEHAAVELDSRTTLPSSQGTLRSHYLVPGCGFGRMMFVTGSV